MREGVPSLTAFAVAFARAAYARAPWLDAPARDELAVRLIPAPLALVAHATEHAWRWPRVTATGLRALSLGFAPHIALRSAAIDAALTAAIGRGVQQVVILGAGLDARAYRLRSLHDATVFEVDHPATQRYKRRRLAGIEPVARSVHFVAVDFVRDALDAALARAGHDASAPTFWVWEGVTPYLPFAAFDDTLARVRSRSAPASEIAFTYVTPEQLAFAPASRLWGPWALALAGEPLHGVIEREIAVEAMRARGWTVLHDTDTRDWAERWRSDHDASHTQARERLLVARIDAP